MVKSSFIDSGPWHDSAGCCPGGTSHLSPQVLISCINFLKSQMSEKTQNFSLVFLRVALAEFFGGLMVLLGFFTRIGEAGIAIIMVVALFTVHLPQGFFIAGEL